MKRLMLLMIVPLFMVSCASIRDALVEVRMGAEEGAKAAIKDLPPPVAPFGAETTFWSSLGALAAYVAGSAGKGYLRSKIGAGKKA